MSSNFSIFDYIDFMNQIKQQNTSIENNDSVVTINDDDEILSKKKFKRINIPNACITNFYNRFYQNVGYDNESESTRATANDSKFTRYRKQTNTKETNRRFDEQRKNKSNKEESDEESTSSSTDDELEVIQI